MPQRLMFQFFSLAERFNLISNPTAMVKEVEIMTTNKGGEKVLQPSVPKFKGRAAKRIRQAKKKEN